MSDFLTLMTLWTETRVWNDLLPLLSIWRWSGHFVMTMRKQSGCCKSYSAEIFNDTHTAPDVCEKMSYTSNKEGKLVSEFLWTLQIELVKHDDEMQRLFILFVASETHPSPDLPPFSVSPLEPLAASILVCWSLQVSDVNKGIDSFHGSTNPCHDLKRHHLRNTCVWNDIRTVCADTDMSMFGCTCTCWYRSEGPSITQALRAPAGGLYWNSCRCCSHLLPFWRFEASIYLSYWPHPGGRIADWEHGLPLAFGLGDSVWMGSLLALVFGVVALVLTCVFAVGAHGTVLLFRNYVIFVGYRRCMSIHWHVFVFAYHTCTGM